MRQLISFLLHPTAYNLILLPIIWLYQIAEIAVAPIPGKVGNFLWDNVDDILDVLNEEFYNSIKNTRSLWDIEIFK